MEALLWSVLGASSPPGREDEDEGRKNEGEAHTTVVLRKRICVSLGRLSAVILVFLCHQANE